jgi:heat-inducible transcriptional repressor
MDKKEFLLHSIIRAYIEHCEPIGSSQLKSMYDIAFSPATIRGYFKKLGEEGYLAQEHISSGRTPTVEALKEYWSKRLDFELPYVKFDKLEDLANDMDLSVFIKQQTKDTLYRVLNLDGVYMILEFYKTSAFSTNELALTTSEDSYAVTIKYNEAFYKFLNDMVGRTFDEILDISLQVGARHLYTQLSGYMQNNTFKIVNTKNFLNLAVQNNLEEKEINLFLQGDVMPRLNTGVYVDNLVPQGQIAICHNTNIDGTDAKILVVGNLSKDYEYFYKGII